LADSIIYYRILSRSEINRLLEIDRAEIVEKIYYHRNGDFVLEDEFWDVSDWSLAEKRSRISQLQSMFDEGATFYGAFHQKSSAANESFILVGMALLTHQPLKTGTDRLNLAGLWVSQPFRSKGIGTQLVNLIIQAAQTRRAKSVYVSATPSENTIRFYRSLGFQSANPVDPDLFTEEPEDIHLELIL